MRSVVTRTARKLRNASGDSWRETLVGIDDAWGEPEVWRAIRSAGERFTLRHYINAIDLVRQPDGSIARQPEERRIYLSLLWRTLAISFGISALCLAIGYPIAHLIAHAPPRRANLLLLLVLVPFWTSLLVRTTAWIVLLQTQGVINSLLVAVGLVADDGRIAMIYNMTGTFVAMTHVLLPFHGPAAVLGDAVNSAVARPSCGFPRRDALSGVLARLLAADPARRRRWIADGVHSRHWLLHHASAGRREQGATHLQHDRLPHADLAQLGTRRRARRHPARGHHRAVRALRPRGGHRPHEAGLMVARWVYLAFCTAAFVFLVAPILVIVPLSFNAEPYFTFTEGMLRLDSEAYSLRWYRSIFEDGVWTRALVNSLVIGVSATLLATSLGTLAALGLANSAMPARRAVMGLLISPMITPVIIAAVGMFFFYSSLGLAQTHLGIILAHAVLGIPFVVITVTATLSGFDQNLMRAAASLGAGPLRSFWQVQLPLIAPGVASGGLFAFAASFDEVVVVLFMGGLEQRTIPRQMWAGIREQISPTILAVATFLIAFAVLALFTVEWLRRRGSGTASSTGSD